MRQWIYSLLYVCCVVWGVESFAATHMHATIVNKLSVSNQDDQDIGAIVFSFAQTMTCH